MIYTANITIPINTAIESPQLTVIPVTNGLVYKVEIVFPRGSAGLAGVAIMDGRFRLWPSSLGEWFVGDDRHISFDDVYLKTSAPFVLNAYTYNLDDSFEHDVYVSIGLVSKDIFMARFLPTMAYAELAKVFEDMQLSQDRALIELKKQMVDDGTEDKLPTEGIL